MSVYLDDPSIVPAARWCYEQAEKCAERAFFLEKREGWRLGAIFPLYPLARGRRGREDNLRSKLVNLSDKRVNLIRILTKQTRKRVNPKTDKARRR